MLGQTIRLPLELCSTSEVRPMISPRAAYPFIQPIVTQDLDEFLRFYFRKRAGRQLVERGDYDISAQNGILIQSAEWTILPGSAINMTAHLHRHPHSESSEKAICPSCDQENLRDGATGITW